jgi:hypothetical protein
MCALTLPNKRTFIAIQLNAWIGLQDNINGWAAFMPGRHTSTESTIRALHQTINSLGSAFKKQFVDTEFDRNCKPGYTWSWTDFLSEIDASSQKVETSLNK